MPKEPTPRKGKQKQIITAVVIVLVLALAVGAGVLVQWLQHKGPQSGNKGATSDTSALDQSGTQAQNTLPDSVKAAQNAASTGDYTQSNKDIASSIASTSSNDEKFELYIQQGVNAENEGKYADALAAYKSANALKQTWANYENLGRASAATGDKANALTYYKKALSMLPTSDPLNELEKNQLQENITSLGG